MFTKIFQGRHQHNVTNLKLSHTTQSYGGMEVKFTIFLTLGLNKDVWLSFMPLSSRGKSPSHPLSKRLDSTQNHSGHDG
jgi:hypothetical protein